MIGGYLGAGKTTLVNYLLRHAGGLRIAVLINDFGELPIDADLIESREDGVISIAGGCVCCSFGSDLIAALMKLPVLGPPPQHVLVETSGVALPGAVARSVTLIPQMRRDATVVLADAETVRARASDRYVGDTVTRQLAEADFVVLNKCDLVPARELPALERWAHAQAPGVRVIRAERAQLPAEVVLGGAPRPPRAGLARSLLSGQLRRVGEAQTVFESAAFATDETLDLAALGAALAAPALGVLRAKGILRDRDGSWQALHVVGARHQVSPARPDPEHAGLVCIGLARGLDAAGIREALARYAWRSPAA